MTDLVFTPPDLGTVLSLTGLPGGSNKIHDRSPYGNQATITGATWKRLDTGLWYLSLDGADDYVDCGNSPKFDITSAVTVEAWMNSSDIDKLWQTVQSKGTDQTYWLSGYGDSGYWQFSIKNAGGTRVYVLTGSVLSQDAWHHLVGTYDGAYVRIYVDGASGGTPIAQTGPIETNTTSLYIGQRGDNLFRFEGGLALIRIYNRALSALEIQNHFNQEKRLFGV